MTEAALRDVARRHASQKGAGLLLDVLAEPGGPRLTRSEAERLLLGMLDETELPRPQTNVWIARFRVDFHWPLEGLVVEVDGRRFHSSRNRFEADRDRDGTLLAAGCTVLRFTWSQLVERPNKVIARIAYMLGRLGALRSIGAAVPAPAPIQRHN